MAVTLIGLPSSGKSTVGVILAKALGAPFIDCDLLIQEREGKLLCEIIAERGVSAFLKLEEEINKTIVRESAVISTGGSAVFGQEAMAHFKSLGPIIYIRIDYETLCKRLGDYTHRGIAKSENETLYELYTKRIPLYEKYADFIIDSREGITPVVEGILNYLKGRRIK